MPEQNRDFAKHSERIELWKLSFAGALLLFIIAVITLTIQTPDWPLLLFDRAQPASASVSQSTSNLALSYTVNPMPVFDAATMEGDVELANGQTNAYSIQVRYVLDADGQVIYESEILAPGDTIQRAVIQTVAAGEHAVTAQIDVLDTSGSRISQATQAVTITVQESLVA